MKLNKKAGVIKIILIVLAVVVVFAAGTVYFTLFRESVEPAVLNIESGIVQVDTGNGWKEAADGMQLSANDKIKTEDSEASVVLFETIIVALEPNTEISILELSKRNPSVRVEQGTTWNKFTKIIGVNSFSIETPTSVATVRGTEFEASYDKESGESDVAVGEGNIEVSSEGEVQKVQADEKLIKLKNKKMLKRALTAEEKKIMQARILKSIQRLKRLRELQIKRQGKILNLLKSRYNVSEESIQRGLRKVDLGEANEEEIIAKLPVKPAFISRIQKINNEIKQQVKNAEALGISREQVLEEIKADYREKLKERILLKKSTQEKINEAVQDKELTQNIIVKPETEPEAGEPAIADAERDEDISTATQR